MKGIELYINRQLCDISNVKDFSIYLKRQFLNPAELSAKDAQRSYDITLPASPTNNLIFDYINTEEVKNKFTNLYDAVVVMGGVKIFEGKFKLSEIASNQYKGNLGIPYSKTIKDIFGEKNMNEVGDWSIFLGYLENLSYYNNVREKDDRGFFFPLVMYGLLPKVPSPNRVYTGKLEVDDTVRLGLEDFPPSLKCLNVIEKLFKAKDIKLTGSAFTDERLTNLYMSYKNPAEYPMPWPYRNLAEIYIKGSWSNGLMHKSVLNRPSLFEMGGLVNTADSTEDAYTCNLLNSTNVSISSTSITNDRGQNISHYQTEFPYNMGNNIGGSGIINRKWNHYSINIPASGYYKVNLRGNLDILNDTPNFRIHDSNNSKMTFVSAIDGGKYLDKIRYELKLVRDWGENSFNIENTAIDGAFYENNFRQSFNNWKATDNESSSFFPYIYNPKYSNGNRNYKPCQMQFVDPAQNPNLVMGFSWGRWADRKKQERFNPMEKAANYSTDSQNRAIWAQTLVAKSCYSWNPDLKDKPLSRVIVNNENGYWKYSKLVDEQGNILATPIFTQTDNLKSILKESPINYARRGYYKGSAKYDLETGTDFNRYADGDMHAIVWFEKGEKLTLVASSDRGSYLHWIWHQIDFELNIEPYRTDKGWAQINEYTGSLINDLSWHDRPAKDYEFLRDDINLMKFLPSNVKIDDWLNNFCKAFNLELIQTGNDQFELNVKKGLNWNTSIIIDLDNRANVTVNRQNTPLGLPGAYQIGFTTDKDEIGYVNTTIKYKPDGSPILDEQGKIKVHEGDDGGGRFETGSPDASVVTQTSNFSHNWMLDMVSKGGYYKSGRFPIISDKEAWNMADNADYGEMMMKDYKDKPLRFWYRADDNYRVKINDKLEIDAGLVTDTYKGSRPMILNYKNVPDSILRNYFTTLTNADNCFTTVECYLSPEEYSDIEYSLVRFNGDLYYIAEVDGYDPLGQKKATLKLIRKTL